MLLVNIKGVSKQQEIILDAYFGDVTCFYIERVFFVFLGMSAVIDEPGKLKRHSHLEKKAAGLCYASSIK